MNAHAEQLDAMVRLLGYDELTPTAMRQLNSLSEAWRSEPSVVSLDEVLGLIIELRDGHTDAYWRSVLSALAERINQLAGKAVSDG